MERKYPDSDSAKKLPSDQLIDELIEAHKNNIAAPNPDFSTLKQETLRRLNFAEAALNLNPQGGWKD